MARKPGHEELERKVRNLEPGAHLCCIYEREEEHEAVLTPFLRQGVERGEKVLYIVDALTAGEVLSYLRQDGLEVEAHVESGQLAILTADESYLREGVFDPDGMISLLKDTMKHALEEGYSALRVTGEMTWALRGVVGSEKVVEYEAKLNEFFPGSKCLAICQYDRRRFGPEVLLDVLATHPIAIIGTEVFENFYYMPPEDFLGPDPARARLDNWLGSLAERKRAEEALRESEEKFRTIAETSIDAIYQLDKTGTVTFMNRAGAEMYGYKREEMEGTNYSSLVSKQVLPEARKYVERVLSGENVQGELYVKHRKGREFPIYFSTVPLIKGNEIIGFTGISRDITERKLTEEALQKAHDELEGRVEERTAELAEANKLLKQEIEERRQAEESMNKLNERLSNIRDSISDGFFTLDDELTVTYFNKAAERLLGCKGEEVLGRKLFEAFPEVKGSIFEEKYSWALKHKSTVAFETFFDVEPYVNWYDVRVYPYEGGISVYFQLTTDRKRAEEALRESENELRHLSSQLLSAQENERKSVAQELHDSIGQTLVAIKFGTENVLKQLPKRASTGITQPLEAAISMVQNAIQEVRRIQTDLRPPTLDDLGVLPTISWFCREFQTIYSGIRIEQHIDLQEDDVPDPLKTIIYRVMQEALSNTAKHSKADLVRLSLKKSNGAITLAIKDNGLGFDLEDVLSVESSKRGIGVSSMKERIELSGGSFAIESATGAGTIIRASWPECPQIADGLHLSES